MPRTTRWICSIMPFMLVAALAGAQAQGKSKGGNDKPDKAQGREAAKQQKPGKASNAVARADKPGNAAKAERAKKVAAGNPKQVDRGRSQSAKEIREVGGAVGRPDFRAFAASNKHGQRLAGRAISRASKRGASDDAFVIRPVGRRVQVLNRSGALLLDLDDDRDVGNWKVVTAKETGKAGSPSFCRSGAGHPVWGRQWCVDKGFGLGDDHGVRWARAVDFENVIFRRQVTADRLARDVLLDVLGDVVFNRLATHAITLGFVEPLSGRWIGEPAGPRVLLLTSGDRPVAEIVDVNRDDRADVMIVALRP